MSNGSWRVDETYIRVKGRWTLSLSGGGQPEGRRSISFCLRGGIRPRRSRFFRKAIAQRHIVNPRTLTVDKNPAYPQSGGRYEKRRSAHGAALVCDSVNI